MIGKSKIIIVGKAGSGKDFLRKKLESKGFKYGVSSTSRPKREGEKEGEDYYFRSLDFFKNNSDLLLGVQEFNGWKYGITRIEFLNNDIFVFNPEALRNLHEDLRKKCFVIYLDIPYDTRKERLLKRNDADTVERRISNDEKDFFNFSDYDIRITNEDF